MLRELNSKESGIVSGGTACYCTCRNQVWNGSMWVMGTKYIGVRQNPGNCQSECSHPSEPDECDVESLEVGTEYFRGMESCKQVKKGRKKGTGRGAAVRASAGVFS